MAIFDRLFGAPDVERLKAKRDIRGLVRLLTGEKNEGLRLSAARALQEVGDFSIYELLYSMLDKEGGELLHAVRKAIDRIVKRFREALKEGDEEAALRDIETLETIADPLALELLLESLRAGSGAVRQAAALALDQRGWSPVNDKAGAHYWIAKGDTARCIEMGEPPISALVANLQRASAANLLHPGENRGNDFLELLERIGPHSVSHLIALLGDRENKRGAARALVHLYRSGNLDVRSSARILEQRSLINSMHHDKAQASWDYNVPNDCTHVASHTDQGWRI